MIGIHQYQISCIIGDLPEERIEKQTIFINVKVRIDLSAAAKSEKLEDTVDYVALAEICNQLAQNEYYLLEKFAVDTVEICLAKFPITWAQVSIQKPKAILGAAYVYVEFEKGID